MFTVPLPSLTTAIADAANLAPPPGPLGWAPYVAAFIATVFAIRAMPNTNAKTVGETLGGLVDRLEGENQRLEDALATERAENVQLRAVCANLEAQVRELVAAALGREHDG